MVLRPLTFLPFSIAHLISPDSFIGWHVLLIVALLIKSLAAGQLIREATGSGRWAMAMSVLVLLYPADTMQLSFRSIHIVCSLALALLACWVFEAACERTTSTSRFVRCMLASALFLLAGCIYEAAFLLLPLPVVLGFVRVGGMKMPAWIAARLPMLCIWLASGALYVFYAAWAYYHFRSYQSEILGGGGIAGTLAQTIPKLFTVGIWHGVAGGWFLAARMLEGGFSNVAYPLVASAAVFAVCLPLWIFARQGESSKDSAGESNFLPLRMAAGGIVLLICGYALYLLVPTHLNINQRTFLFATPGAAMIWVAVLMAVIRWKRWLGAALAFSLVTLGLGAQLYQFQHYAQISTTQTRILRGIVENLDPRSNATTLLLLDESQQLGSTWMLLPGNLELALDYLAPSSIEKVQICGMPGGEWAKPGAFGRKGTCVETETAWVFRGPAPLESAGDAIAREPDLVVPKENVRKLTVLPDGFVVPDPSLEKYRTDLAQSDSTSSRRYRGILLGSDLPARFGMFKDTKRADRYQWSFGDYWSLDLPVRGSGWREAEWIVRPFSQKSVAWKTGETAALLFDLEPKAGGYTLSGKCETIPNDEIRSRLRFRLNGNDLIHRLATDGSFSADVPAGILRKGGNTLEVIAPCDPKTFGLSLQLDYVEIVPSDPQAGLTPDHSLSGHLNAFSLEDIRIQPLCFRTLPVSGGRAIRVAATRGLNGRGESRRG